MAVQKKVKKAEVKESVRDTRGMSRAALQDLELIGKGYLPPADTFGVNGEPSWTIDSFAKILGVDRSTLVKHIHKAGRRFEISAGRGVVEFE